jgi:hypothetical protein
MLAPILRKTLPIAMPIVILAGVLTSCVPATSPENTSSSARFKTGMDLAIRTIYDAVLADAGVPEWSPKTDGLDLLFGTGDSATRRPKGGWQIVRSDGIGGTLLAVSKSEYYRNGQYIPDTSGTIEAVVAGDKNNVLVKVNTSGRARYMEDKIFLALEKKFKKLP